MNSDTILFDVSNACLGFATGLSVVSNMIELGQIEAGMVVSSEAASEVVENTIKALVENPSEELLLASIPSLTLGSGSLGWLVSITFCAANFSDCVALGLSKTALALNIAFLILALSLMWVVRPQKH